MPVPDAPGLGVSVDEEAIAKYRVDPAESTPTQHYMAQKRILRVYWPGDGKEREWEFTAEAHYQQAFYAGNIPGFEQGVDLEVIEDDNRRGLPKATRGSVGARALVPLPSDGLVVRQRVADAHVVEQVEQCPQRDPKSHRRR